MQRWIAYVDCNTDKRNEQKCYTCMFLTPAWATTQKQYVYVMDVVHAVFPRSDKRWLRRMMMVIHFTDVAVLECIFIALDLWSSRKDSKYYDTIQNYVSLLSMVDHIRLFKKHSWSLKIRERQSFFKWWDMSFCIYYKRSIFTKKCAICVFLLHYLPLVAVVRS